MYEVAYILDGRYCRSFGMNFFEMISLTFKLKLHGIEYEVSKK